MGVLCSKFQVNCAVLDTSMKFGTLKVVTNSCSRHTRPAEVLVYYSGPEVSTNPKGWTIRNNRRGLTPPSHPPPPLKKNKLNKNWCKGTLCKKNSCKRLYFKKYPCKREKNSCTENLLPPGFHVCDSPQGFFALIFSYLKY